MVKMPETILKVKDLNIELDGQEIIKNLSFDVKRGEILTILGPNGAGKTVLLKTLLGLLPYKEEIEWFPTIDGSKCVGCGMCVTGCSRKVYDFDKEKNKSVVTRPFNCMVGCTTCQVLCLQDAISFPDKEYVRNLIVKEGLIAKAKKELQELI